MERVGGWGGSGREKKKGGEVRKVVVENGSETGGLKNFEVGGGMGMGGTRWGGGERNAEG